MRLNLGAGAHPLRGYINLDRKTGGDAYPLAYQDESVDEVRASHLLEHFPHGQTLHVLREWARVIKPGGVLKIAVPNFEWIVQQYLAGEALPIEGYVMGGQVDRDDFHHALFDAETLAEMLQEVGLVDVKPWHDCDDDCSALPVSLNLQGTKPEPGAAQTMDVRAFAQTVGASMSVPRLGFMDNFFAAFQALVPLGIELRKQSGAFWGQCLTRSIEEWIKEGKQWVLTVDYDTVYTRQDVEQLLRLAMDNPHADAIAPVQASRTRAYPLMTIKGTNGKNLAEVPFDLFDPDLTAVSTAHFGLTLIKVEALQAMEKPWFYGQPDGNGEWGEGRVDDDIWFWRQFEKAGRQLYLANRVAVGHAELMIRWPGSDFVANYQHPSDFYADGKPADVWK